MLSGSYIVLRLFACLPITFIVFHYWTLNVGPCSITIQSGICTVYVWHRKFHGSDCSKPSYTIWIVLILRSKGPGLDAFSIIPLVYQGARPCYGRWTFKTVPIWFSLGKIYLMLLWQFWVRIFQANLCHLDRPLQETFFVPIFIEHFYVNLSMDRLNEYWSLLYSDRYWLKIQRSHDAWVVFLHSNGLHSVPGTSSYSNAWSIPHQVSSWSWVVVSMSTFLALLKFDSYYGDFRPISWIDFSATSNAHLL